MFDSKMPPEGKEFYTLSTTIDPWQTTHMFDVDGDREQETIITADVAMNHTPHILKVLKNYHTVIFEAEGAGLDIEKAPDNKGFFLIETIDWNNNVVKRTRYLYENGGFTPAWYQESKNCTLQ